MIGWLLRFLFSRPWGLIVLGVLIMNLGAFLTFAGYDDLPERTALKQVTGVLDGAVKMTRRRSGSVRYELEIKTASGELVKLTLPEREISENQVKGLLGRPISAKYGGTKDVWELTSGTATIIDYEATRRSRQETQAIEAEFGPYVGGGGLLVALLGVFWLLRLRRTAEATA